jgi:nitronate monooxygenase
MTELQTRLTDTLGIEVPLICGAMYPCSNPELIAAVSEAGGIGIIQPVSLIFVFDYDLRKAIRYIKSLTDKPIGFNAIVEKSKFLQNQMRGWIDVALDEGVRFFITALGNPAWVVERVKAKGGLVFHDVTERKWALKALDNGIEGLICVNNRAGGHAGRKDPVTLYRELSDLGVPLIRAGGIGSPDDFAEALLTGYDGVQMGTRFIATHECKVHDDYKRAIVEATADQIVMTDKISGVPCSVIETPFVKKMGTKAGPIARRLLRNPRTKYLMRTVYSLQSVWKFKKAALRGTSYKDYFQAGKSVDGVDQVEHAGDVVKRFAEGARAALSEARSGAA